MPAPRGSRQAASELARLVREYGAETVSRWVDLPVRSVERIVARAERGLSLEPVIRSAGYLERLREGLSSARERAQAFRAEREASGFRRVGPDRWATPPLEPQIDEAFNRTVAPAIIDALRDDRDVWVNNVRITTRVPDDFRPDQGGRLRPPLRYVDLPDALRRVEDLQRAGVPQVTVVYDPETDTWTVWKPRWDQTP
jgi:hypothetical protein